MPFSFMTFHGFHSILCSVTMTALLHIYQTGYNSIIITQLHLNIFIVIVTLDQIVSLQ